MKRNNSLLRVNNLTKVFQIGGRLFGSRLVAVDGVSFEMSSTPEVLAIAGESGCGKSTLARMILGILEPTSGELLYKGRDITRIRNRRDRMAFMKEVQPVFQNPFETFNPLKRVDSYLVETTVNFGVARAKNESRSALDKILKSLGLSSEEVGARYPHELSGGQVQRLAIARALLPSPSLLVADEPVSMVDASLKMSIVNLFKELKEQYGISVIYITHDLATAYYISDKIAIMYRGSIVEMGPVEKVMLSPLHPYTKLLIESVPQPRVDLRWDKAIKLSAMEVKEFSKMGCKFADRCPQLMDVCRRVKPANVAVDRRLVMCHLYAKEKSSVEAVSEAGSPRA